MKTRPVLALAALAVGVVGAAAPALASSPRTACPKAASGTTATVEGVVVKPETPAAKPAPSARPATATASSATATATTKPAKAATLEIKVVKGTKSMKGKSYTVVDCSGAGASARRKDTVKVVSYRVKGDSHRLYASSITVTKRAAAPAAKPTAKPTAKPSGKPAHR